MPERLSGGIVEKTELTIKFSSQTHGRVNGDIASPTGRHLPSQTMNTLGFEVNSPMAHAQQPCAAGARIDAGISLSNFDLDHVQSLSKAQTCDIGVVALQSSRERLRNARALLEMEYGGGSIKSGSLARVEAPASDADFSVKVRYHVGGLVSSQKFDSCIGLVILLNSVLIGVEMSYQVQIAKRERSADGDEMVFLGVMEIICLSVYTGELGLRFFVWGASCLKSGWVSFDFVLVSIGLINMCIIGPVGIESDKLAPVLVLRVMRLLRLARAVRLLVQFKTLWMLVRGLLSSALTVLYTVVLFFIIIYVFACLGVELITKHPMSDPLSQKFDEEFSDIVNLYFCTLQMSMLTLVQFVFMDSASAIYFPLVIRDPSLMLYFVALMLVVSVSLMNLVTAVIVEGALEQATSDKEAQDAYEAERVKKLMPALKELFKRFDRDGSGNISKDEVINAPNVLKEQLAKVMAHWDAVEIFDILDVDCSGFVEIDEFCDGIMNSATLGNDQVHYMRLHKQLSQLKGQQERRMKRVEGNLDRVEGKLDQILLHLTTGGTPSVVSNHPSFPRQSFQMRPDADVGQRCTSVLQLSRPFVQSEGAHDVHVSPLSDLPGPPGQVSS